MGTPSPAASKAICSSTQLCILARTSLSRYDKYVNVFSNFDLSIRWKRRNLGEPTSRMSSSSLIDATRRLAEEQNRPTSALSPRRGLPRRNLQHLCAGNEPVVSIPASMQKEYRTTDS